MVRADLTLDHSTNILGWSCIQNSEHDKVPALRELALLGESLNSVISPLPSISLTGVETVSQGLRSTSKGLLQRLLEKQKQNNQQG